jgi:predicted enzyme related to lactoylglutathione lyase
MVEMKEGQWCHVEIPASDPKKAQRFYGEVFGWKFQEIPQMAYTLYDTGENGIGGGFWNPEPGMPRQIVNYILVNEIEPVVARVKNNGGKELKGRPRCPAPAGSRWSAIRKAT